MSCSRAAKTISEQNEILFHSSFGVSSVMYDSYG
jgi:hypothetical protein